MTSLATQLAASHAARTTKESSGVEQRKQNTTSLVGEFENQELDSVRVDALAVLKIVRHSRQQPTNSQPAGQLLGLDNSGLLDVSDCYPFPPNHIFPVTEYVDDRDRDHTRAKETSFDTAAANASAYTAQFLPRLAELNADANVIGFYATTNSGMITGDKGSLIEALARYQVGSSESSAASSGKTRTKIASTEKKGPGRGVALVYDISSASSGTISLRAFRLTESYLAVHKAGRFDAQSLAENQCIPSKVLKEYPVTISRSSLLTAFLSTLAAPESSRVPSISSPRQASLSAPSFNALAVPSVAPGAPGSLSLPLQALLNSFDASLNAIGNLRHKDRRGGNKSVGDSHLEAIKHLSAADGAAGALLQATGVALGRLEAAKAVAEAA